MITNLLALLSILFFISCVAVIIAFLKFAVRQRKLNADIIDKNLYEKDLLIKKNLVLEEESKSLIDKNEALNRSVESEKLSAEKYRDENKNLFAKLSELSAYNRNLSEKAENLKSDYEERLERQKKEFFDFKQAYENLAENLSSKILDDKSKKLSEINKESIGIILNPLSEKIAEFQKKVEDVYVKESNMRYSLQDEIKKLLETQQTMKRTTENLTDALKGSGKVQGDWGEMILEQLLEYSALIEGMQYEIQPTVKSINEMDEKINLRPDVIVHLPKGRDIIIDSKVSLTDYEKYMSLSSSRYRQYRQDAVQAEIFTVNENAENLNPDMQSQSGSIGGITSGKYEISESDNDADKYLKFHLLSIKKHINELNTKKYSNLTSSKGIDSVIMFIPIEFAYTIAVNYDKELLNYAYSKNVIIATPSIIMLILKIVQNLWVQEKSQENAAEVMAIAGQLYDKFCSFAKSMDDIGASIDKTSVAYDNARKILVTGKGSMMSRFEKIRSLGAKTTKSLPAEKFNGEE